MAQVPADNLMFGAASLAQENTSVTPDAPSLFVQTLTNTATSYNRWNKAYPYQFLLVHRTQGGKWERDATCKRWVFTLPFPPESLTLSAPSSVVVSATQNGILEEHNAIVFMPIAFSGTTGVLPLRGSTPQFANTTLADAIFAGTLTNAQRITASAEDMVHPYGPPKNPGNLVLDDEFAQKFQGSGYYQARLLLKFWEDYHAFKKTDAGRDYQLAFAMWKDESVYLVTPQNFVLKRTAASPFEYMYDISLKAWSRIDIGTPDNAFSSYRPDIRNANKLAKTLQVITQARTTLSNLRDTIAAIGADVSSLFEPLRELSLFAKDLLGIPLAMVDLPTQILQNSKKTIIAFIATKEAFQGASASIDSAAQDVPAAWRQIAELGARLGATETAGTSGYSQTSFNPETDSANVPFNEPDKYYSLFSLIKPGDMKLPPAVIGQIATERQRVRSLTRLDFEQRRDAVKQLMADFADYVGAGDPTYNRTYSRPIVNTNRTPTASDFRVMYAMNRVVGELNRLAMSGETNRFQLNATQFVAALAGRSGIPFTIPVSKRSVPFRYGETLEELADRYLGDPDRWIEIATLNNLRSPYVDEEGFDLPLLASGSGNEVIVADSSNLFIGQMVWLSASNTARTIRHITKLRVLSPNQTTVTVDGNPDLSRFTVLGQASLHAFLPNTVNSMQTLWIPSSVPSTIPDFQTKSIPGLDITTQLFTVGGVDLLLTTDTNDLVVTPDGDGRLAVGLTALVQDARIKMSVPRGTLLLHKNFGFLAPVGSSLSDLDANTLLLAAQETFAEDPVYTAVNAASVQINGGAIQVYLGLGVAGIDQDIPISFSLPPSTT